MEFPIYGSVMAAIRLGSITAIEEIKYGNGKSDCLIYCGEEEAFTVKMPYEKVIERIRDCVDATD